MGGGGNGFGTLGQQEVLLQASWHEVHPCPFLPGPSCVVEEALIWAEQGVALGVCEKVENPLWRPVRSAVTDTGSLSCVGICTPVCHFCFVCEKENKNLLQM